MRKTLISSFLLALSLLPLYGEPDVVEVTLINPRYVDGVLSTEEGGRVIAPLFRLQAKEISYTKTKEQNYLIASKDLLVEYEGHFITGDSLFYDFSCKSGYVANVRSSIFPFSFNGESIALGENGSLILSNAALFPDTFGEHFSLCARKIALSCDQTLFAEGVSLNCAQSALFTLPPFSISCAHQEDFPFSLRYGFHGYLGSYIGLRYHFLSLGEFKGYARLDGYFGHGLGGGIETIYSPCDSPSCFYTKNYFANDIAISDPKEKNRYRFQGLYSDFISNPCFSINLQYDKVSDAEMASDYINDDFELETAQKTLLLLHHANSSYIFNLSTQVKLNSFQTINQELPTLELNIRPFEIGSSGIISDNYFKASYLDFSFSDKVAFREDFHSGRFELRPRLYRPFSFDAFHLTPSATFVGIYYSNNPFDEAVGQELFDLALDSNFAFYQHFSCLKHVVEPYMGFHYLTPPRSALSNHYIFTIDDAYDTLKILRFGIKQLFSFSECRLPLTIDLFANYFIDSKALGSQIPKVYLNATLEPFDTVSITSLTGYNAEFNLLDFSNNRIDWTLSENFAISTEWRHRSKYAWRKADFYNFLLENVRTNEELLHSDLSDQNDLILLKFFYRLHPDLTAKLELREGWHRRHQGPFTEYQIETETPIFENFRLGLVYEKKESDNRYLVRFTKAISPP